MNTKERETIQRYRKTFPNDTLKIISAKTGIQLTRVFRIMNGKAMKVSELESFENILGQRIGQDQRIMVFENLTKIASLDLSVRDIEIIISYIERKLENSKIIKQAVTHQIPENLIA